MREPDVLDLAAKEHRELQRSLREVTADRGSAPEPLPDDVLTSLAAALAHHEALDRLLLYPLVGRDGYGRRSLDHRRAEQRSISDQLALAIRAHGGEGPPGGVSTVLAGLRLTFVGHADREEIEDFPHARRLSSRDERQELGHLRHRLRIDLAEQLPTVPAASRRGEASGQYIGPVQAAIVAAKEILSSLDRSRVRVG